MLSPLGHNTLIQLIGKLLATLAGLVVVAFMTRSLGPTGFGHYTTIIAFLLASLTQSFQAVFQASLKSGYLVAADLAGKLLLLVGTILVAQLNLGLMAFLMVYTASSAIIA